MKTTAPPAPSRTFTYQPPAWAGLGPFTETCPRFCRTDHTAELDGMHPEDLWHQQFGPSICTPLTSTDAEPLHLKVLEAQLTVRPHALNPAEQVPHVCVQFHDGLEASAMDPDQFAELIGRLAGYVDNLKIMHGQLVQAVAEHQAGGQ